MSSPFEQVAHCITTHNGVQITTFKYLDGRFNLYAYDYFLTDSDGLVISHPHLHWHAKRESAQEAGENAAEALVDKELKRTADEQKLRYALREYGEKAKAFGIDTILALQSSGSESARSRLAATTEEVQLAESTLIGLLNLSPLGLTIIH